MPTVAFLPLGLRPSDIGFTLTLTHQDVSAQITGATTTFILDYEYVSGSLQVYHNGILQLDDDIAQLTSDTFSMSTTPQVGDSLMIIYIKQQP